MAKGYCEVGRGWDSKEKEVSEIINPFMPTVQTFAVRETDASRHNGGTSGAPLKPLRVDSAGINRLTVELRQITRIAIIRLNESPPVQ